MDIQIASKTFKWDRLFEQEQNNVIMKGLRSFVAKSLKGDRTPLEKCLHQAVLEAKSRNRIETSQDIVDKFLKS